MAAYSITLSGGGTLLNADGGTLLLDYEQGLFSGKTLGKNQGFSLTEYNSQILMSEFQSREGKLDKRQILKV